MLEMSEADIEAMSNADAREQLKQYREQELLEQAQVGHPPDDPAIMAGLNSLECCVFPLIRCKGLAVGQAGRYQVFGLCALALSRQAAGPGRLALVKLSTPLRHT